MYEERKKILWQSHEANLSGANIAMLEYIDALAKSFHSFVLLPHQGNMQQSLERRNVPYMIIHQNGWTNVYPWWHFFKWIKVIVRSIVAVRHTIRLIQNQKPSIVCTNTLIPFTTSIVAKYVGLPHVWWIHEFGKEDFGFVPCWGNEKFSSWWMQNSTKLFICNSRAVSAKYHTLMPKAHIDTIYQPVSWNPVIDAKTPKYATFLMFGQLIPSKGHIDVLKAMLINKQRGKFLQSLHIIGPCEDDSYLFKIQDFVNKNDLLDFVKIKVGFFNKEEVLPHYEILIVASLSEAFGRVIVEANKAGLRVLVRQCGGAQELINESNGFLFSTREDLASLLSKDYRCNTSAISCNYNETQELEKLTTLLFSICK